MKKRLAKAMAIGLSLGMLTGISGLSVQAQDTKTITLLSWYSEQQLGEFIDEFEAEYPGIKIDLQVQHGTDVF